MKFEYKIISEETQVALDLAILHYQDKHIFSDFKVCYVDFDRGVALIRYNIEA